MNLEYLNVFLIWFHENVVTNIYRAISMGEFIKWSQKQYRAVKYLSFYKTR